MSTELMPQGYFDSIQQRMIIAGFALISRVQIDNSECTYHAHATKARATTLLFHLLGKSLLILLRYTESDFDDTFNQIHILKLADDKITGGEVRGSWQMIVCARYKPYGQLIDENPQWVENWLHDGENRNETDLPILENGRLEHPGFHYHTGLGWESSCEVMQFGIQLEQERGDSSTPLDPSLLIETIKKISAQLGKYLAKGLPFERVSLSGFSGRYCWSSSSHDSDGQGDEMEYLFWSRVDWKYFLRFVKGHYGYVTGRVLRQKKLAQAIGN